MLIKVLLHGKKKKKKKKNELVTWPPPFPTQRKTMTHRVKPGGHVDGDPSPLHKGSQKQGSIWTLGPGQKMMGKASFLVSFLLREFRDLTSSL